MYGDRFRSKAASRMSILRSSTPPLRSRVDSSFHRDKVFDLSELKETLLYSEDGATAVPRSMQDAIFPKMTNPVVIPSSSSVGNYLHACAQNVRAELWALCSETIKPTFAGWREKFEAINIRFRRHNNEIRVLEFQYQQPDSAAEEDGKKVQVCQEELLTRLMYNLVLFEDRLGIILAPSVNSDTKKEFLCKILLGAHVRDPFLDSGLHSPKREGNATEKGEIHIVAYVGSYIKDLDATLTIQDAIGGSRYLELKKPSNVDCASLRFVSSVADPKEKRSSFGYKVPSSLDPAIPHNASQYNSLAAMKTNVEGIQGPPGSGKSTTIYHLVRSVLPEDYLAIVTCVQNKAIDAIAEKLAKSIDSVPFIVGGSIDRLGDTSAKFLLSAQVDREPSVIAAKMRLDKRTAIRRLFVNLKNELIDLMAGDSAFRAKLKMETCKTSEQKDMFDISRPWDRLWSAYILRQRGLEIDIALSQEMEGEVRSAHTLIRVAQEKRIVSAAKAVLCTIDATCRLFPEGTMQEILFPKKKVAIIDEAGTVPEYKVPLLGLLGCEALVCIGDQNQLAPFTHCAKTSAESSGQIGLFHRLALALNVPMLTHQYRMHPTICRYVSSAFYSGQLITPPEVAAARLRIPQGGIMWVDYSDVQAEETPGARHKAAGKGGSGIGSSSLLNSTELNMVFRMLCEDHMGIQSLITDQRKSVMVITFYKQQFRQMLDTARSYGILDTIHDKQSRRKKDVMVPPYDQVRFVTVDASQGSEADVVILSCVRCNAERRTGFLSNRNRMCVAVSRAKERLIVIGSSRTLTGPESGMWSDLYNSAQRC